MTATAEFGPMLRTGEAPELPDEELAGMQAFGEISPERGSELTDAEMELMRQNGVGIPQDVVYDYKAGDVIYQSGTAADDPVGIKVRVGHVVERVTIYESSGHPVVVRADWVRHYLSKVDRDGAVFHARPPVPWKRASIPCPVYAGRCRNLYTEEQALKHFQFRHPQEYHDREVARQLAEERRGNVLMERLLMTQELQAQQQGVNLSSLPRVPAVNVVPVRNPEEAWPKSEMIKWCNENGLRIPATVIRGSKGKLWNWIMGDEGQADNG